MTSRKILSTFLLLSSSIAIADSVQIVGVSSRGTGCPDRSVSVVITSDLKTMSMIFDRYISEIDGLHTITDKKFCNVDVQLRITSGWSVSLLSADYRGFAELDSGTLGAQEVIYKFDSEIVQSSFSSQVMKGPFSGDYVFKNLAPFGGTPIGSPCGGEIHTLHIQTTILTYNF